MTGKYLLIHIVLINLVFYLLTFILYKAKFITRLTHRKIWNTILLLAFVVSVFLGLFSVFKVNYKLTFSWYDIALRYHVEAGVILAVTGIIHFIWHFSYYLKLFNSDLVKHKSETNDSPINELSDKKILLLLFLTGLISTCTQIIYLREFFAAFYGNEFLFGITLSLWLLFSGIGSYAARRKKINITALSLKGKLIWMIWLPAIMLVLLFVVKDLFFIRGEQVSLTGILIFSAVILMIPCFFFGYFFTVLAAGYSKNKNRIGLAYGFETIGSIAGGLLVNFILVFIFNSFQITAVLILSGYLILMFIDPKKKINWVFPVSLIFVIILFVPSTSLKIRQLLYSPFTLTNSFVLPSGNLDYTEYDNQINLYHNNILLYHSQNKEDNEEKVHYAMLLHPDPEKVLVISSGLTGITEEIRKYKEVKVIDIIEPDKWYAKILLNNPYFDSISHYINIIHQDPRRYINSTKQKYDMILMNAPNPISLFYNRYYSSEYFNMLKRIMNDNGILSVSYSAGVNYLDEYERQVMGLIYNSIKTAFPYCYIVPANTYFLIGTNIMTDLNYETLIKEKAIENEYVNQYYLNDMLLNQRASMILTDISDVKTVNHDLLPLAFLNQIRVYMKYNKWGYHIFGLILFIIFLLFYFFQPNHRKGMFLTSFACMSVEMITIFALQVILGNAFYITGIVITFYMIFLASGAVFYNFFMKKADKLNFLMSILLFGIFCILFLFIITWAVKENPNEGITYFIFLIVAAISGFFAGSVFTRSSYLDTSSAIVNASGIYSADLLGASLGAIITSIYLVPLFGVIITLLIIGAMLIIYSIIGLIKK